MPYKEYQKVKDKAAERARRNSNFIKRVKRLFRCDFCGTKENLTFHHVDPSTKLFSISRAGSKALSTIKREIRKCIPLCHNCHTNTHALDNDTYNYVFSDSPESDPILPTAGRKRGGKG